MIYVYWYLGIGAALTLCLRTIQQLKGKNEPELHEIVAELTGAPNNPPASIRKLLINWIAVVLVGVICWPVIVWVWIQEHFSNRPEATQEFIVCHDHLQKRLSVEEIEARERVDDPLGAVPALPFGHLNMLWHQFLTEHTNDSEIWSFSATYTTDWGDKEYRAGYVTVKSGKAGGFFLVMRKPLLDGA